MAITHYDAYLNHLEKLYIKNGNVILSDSEIKEFIRVSGIGSLFGITISDVKNDLKEIERKWNPSATKIMLNKVQYLAALKTLYLQNNKNLTDQQIEIFIKDNVFQPGIGMTVADVKRDLQSIKNKLNDLRSHTIYNFEEYERELSAFLVQNGDKSFLDININKFISIHGMDNNSPTLMSDIRIDLVYAQSKLPLSSDTAKAFRKMTSKKAASEQQSVMDDKFISEITKIILNHKEVFSQKPLIKGILWDCFPDKKREINVLMILVNYGMLEDMQLERNLNSVFINKYVSRVINEYGVEKNFATEMALVWCHGYGVGVLGKELIL